MITRLGHAPAGRVTTGVGALQITRWVLRGGRFAALPRQARKGIDQDWPWKSLR
jgi:hypothetical protein